MPDDPAHESIGSHSTIAARLRHARTKANMQQAEVAAALDVSRPTVSEWEAGRKTPSLDHARELALTFRVSLDWLVLGIAQPNAVETPAEAELVTRLRLAPPHIRAAITELLRPYSGKQ